MHVGYVVILVLDKCRSGIKLSREIAAQPAFGAYVSDELHPGAAASSDAAIDAFIRDTVCSNSVDCSCYCSCCWAGNPRARGNTYRGFCSHIRGA